MKLFLAEYHYGEITAAMDAVRPSHREYLQAQQEKGLIAAAGRATNANSAAGVFIIPAEDEESARAVLTGDPFQTEGFVRELTLRRWSLTFGEVDGYTVKDLDPE